ncbi:hypothetical protein BDN67DRAFT_1016791 [Paxillus ammoniavirescens]|nr:hypothetical protein BDN67DRAFT_1016791 [Paxillus ammoniavirescens]
MKTRSGSLYVAIPSGPRPKPQLKRKDPNAVHLTEEENFQLTFNRAKRSIEKLPNTQPNNAEATIPARRDDDAESATPNAEAKVVDPPPRTKVNSRCPPTATYSRKDKSKSPLQHRRCLDNDKADHHTPSTEDEEDPPFLPSIRPRAHPPLQVNRHNPFRHEKSKGPSEHSRRLDNDDNDGDGPLPSPTSHIESISGVATGTAGHLEDETLADVEHVEQLMLLGDATPSNGHEEGDPYEVEPETKAFNEDISNDESDAYKPNDANEDADKGEEEGEEEEEEEVLLSPKVIQTKGKAWTAPSKVKGGKKKAKRAALLSDLEPTDESDQEPEGRKSRKGPLSKEALAECEEFGCEMEERAIALAKKFGKKPWSIFAAASLSASALRKESAWNMHQSWFFATQGQDDEDIDGLRARQKEHYEALRDSEEGEEKWDIMRQYYIEMAAGVESGSKSSAGRVMAAQDACAKSATTFCRLQNLHIFGFVIHTGVEEDSLQASGMWAGSPLVRKIIDENHMDLKRMIDWWTTVIKFAHIQDSEDGPSMPAIGSGCAVNLIEYLCRAGEPVCDRNRRVLKAMLVPHGYVKRSVLWQRLFHKAENLHFTILNWPEEVPVPDTQFDFHKLDANKVLKLLANFLIDRLGPMYKPEGEDDGENSKAKAKGNKGKGKVVEEPYVPQDGDDLAFVA